jgi:hypothetical protein
MICVHAAKSMIKTDLIRCVSKFCITHDVDVQARKGIGYMQSICETKKRRVLLGGRCEPQNEWSDLKIDALFHCVLICQKADKQ